MERKNLFDDAVFRDLVARVKAVQSNDQRKWGTMTAGQMMAHCAEVIDVANGKNLRGTPFIIRMIGGFIKKVVLNDKPYPQGVRTHPQYVVEGDKDIEKQRQRLLASMEALRENPADHFQHDLFGKMTREEVGWGMYKHLDHHLRQFGV
jgi:hypothetical protein